MQGSNRSGVPREVADRSHHRLAPITDENTSCQY